MRGERVETTPVERPGILASLSGICRGFDYFVIDLWGVLHDGTASYPGAIEALGKLRGEGKRIALLSNAPRRAFKAEAAMDRLGFARDLYDHIHTSGEAAYRFLENTTAAGESYYYIGPAKDEDILAGLTYRRTRSPKNADFALATGYDNFGDSFEAKLPEADLCLEAGLPLICPNPDRKVVRQSGEIMPCAGLIGEYYARRGGEVRWFGKPYPGVYEDCFEYFGTDDVSRMVAIGDGLHTDIAGARSMGIFSVLVAGGILAGEIGMKYGRMPEPEVLESLFKKENVRPDAVIPAFAW